MASATGRDAVSGWTSAIDVITVPPMAVGPRGDSQIQVECETGTSRFNLRLYADGQFTVPSWWIGEFDSTGELLRTETSNAAEFAPGDLRRWLDPIVGSDTAGRLARLAIKEATKPHRDPEDRRRGMNE